MTTNDEYRVSEKVTLRRGDLFRASRGPYWTTADGTKISMAERGKMVFIEHEVADGGGETIRARQGLTSVVLIIKRSRRKRLPEITYRAYKIRKCRMKKEPKPEKVKGVKCGKRRDAKSKRLPPNSGSGGKKSRKRRQGAGVCRTLFD